MPSVRDALRTAWRRLDSDFRGRYPYRPEGQPEDVSLPGQDFYKYLFPAIFDRKVLPKPLVPVCSVNNPKNWDRQLRELTEADFESMPEEFRVQPAEFISREIQDHAEIFYSLDKWAEDLAAIATENGRPFRSTDFRTVKRWAFEAALRLRRSQRSDYTRADALREVFIEKRSDEVRDVDELKNSLTNPDIVDSVTAILNTWQPIVASAEAVDAESTVWEKHEADLHRAWDADGDLEHLALEVLWGQIVDYCASAGFASAWRARAMELSGEVLEPGARHGKPALGDHASLHAQARPIEYTIYRRLNGMFGSGAAEMKRGFPGFEVILEDCARRALEPFSLRDPASRAALLIAYFAWWYIQDPTVRLQRTDDDLAGQELPDSELVAALTSKVYWRLAAVKAGADPSLAEGQDGLVAAGVAADHLGNPMILDAEAGLSVRGRRRTRSHRRAAMSAGDVERWQGAFERTKEIYMRDLWVRLHNDEVRLLRRPDESMPSGWLAAKALLLEIAGKTGGRAASAARKTPAKQMNTEAIELVESPPTVPGHGLGPRQIQAEARQTLPHLNDLRGFLAAAREVNESRRELQGLHEIERLLKSQQYEELLVRIPDLDLARIPDMQASNEDAVYQAQQSLEKAWGIANNAWVAARQRLKGSAQRSGTAWYEIPLDDVLALWDTFGNG